MDGSKISVVDDEILRCSTIDSLQKPVRRSPKLCSLGTRIFSDLHNMK